MDITELGLSPTTLTCLDTAGIVELEQLTDSTPTELLQSGVGAEELCEIVCQLNHHNLTLTARPGRYTSIPSDRDREMLRLRIIEGLSLEGVGQRIGLHRERVRQLMYLRFGLTGKPPGAKKRRGWRL
jgi:hypothetical protein